MKTHDGTAFEDETMIIPELAAETVFEELERWFNAELPKPWIDELAIRARTIYSHNPRFRAILCRPGSSGRDSLYAFMRHWLAALLLKHDAALFHRLPDSYTTGEELPLHALTVGPTPARRRRSRRKAV